MFGVRTLQDRIKLCKITFHRVIEITLLFMMFTGIFGSSFANTMDTAIVHNTGRILPYILAASGYWRDIQDAVDLAASLGGGNVYIPEGVWNFVNPGEIWTGARVVIPAGVNVFGAPTERYTNGSVVEWKTVLVLPWDVPGDVGYDPPKWFLIQGNSDPNKPSRFSDIKLVGYREFDHDSVQILRGIKVDSVINFRIDHCCFRHIPEGIWVDGIYCCGVIDHCVLDNVYGNSGGTDWSARTVGYGVRIDRTTAFTEWEPLENLLGKYTNHTVFIENCVFTKWRHCVTLNYGAHCVFRYNIVTEGLAFGEVDIHPSWNEPYVGGRCLEVYENLFINPVGESGFVKLASVIHSGSGVWFNNTLSGYEHFIQTNDNGWNSDYYPHDMYIWGNELGGAVLISGSAIENEDYFLYRPDWYTPYPYPHTLTLK